MCSNCLALLTEDKILEFEESNSVYALIQLQDRGGLKWPSVPVLEAVSMMWSLFVYVAVGSRFQLKRVSTSRNPFQLEYQLKRVPTS